jgi:YbbR-like protein
MAAQSDINFILQFGKKLKTFFFSKDLLSFLLFIVLSSAFWWIHALDKERVITLVIPLKYTGVPKSIQISNQIPSKISLNVKDKGLNLFSYSNDQTKPLLLDIGHFNQRKGGFAISTEELRANLGHYLLPSTQLVDLFPSTIFVQYESLFEKNLPVELLTHLECAPQYMLSRSIQITPQKVSVYGSKKSLDALKAVQTEFVVLKDISDSTTFTCKLKPKPGLRYMPDEVNVRICVEQFTEKKIQLPINTLNCPKNIRIRTFPAFVNVTYRVGLSQFNNVDSNDIAVSFDYNDLVLAKEGKQKLKFTNKSSHISNIRIQPQEIEVLLEKK